MLDYTSEHFKGRQLLRVLDLQRGHDCEVIINSSCGVQVVQHFLKRSLLCTGNDDCPLCLMSNTTRALTYITGIVNATTFLIRLPAEFPPEKCKPGLSIFLKRARRNNRLTFQHGMFQREICASYDERALWRMVMTLYKVAVAPDFSSDNSEHVRHAKMSMQQILESAAVHCQSENC